MVFAFQKNSPMDTVINILYQRTRQRNITHEIFLFSLTSDALLNVLVNTTVPQLVLGGDVYNLASLCVS